MGRVVKIWGRGSVALLCLMAPALQAEPLFNMAQRAALGAEIRAVLLDTPQIVDQALNPPSAYEEAVSADIDRLTALAPRLFDPAQNGFGAADATHRIALFVKDDCADCTKAVADLRALAQAHDLRVTLHRLDDNGASAALAAQLDLSEAPSYALPEMMLQGYIPPVVLERYLRR
jgi:hypothetical protein